VKPEARGRMVVSQILAEVGMCKMLMLMCVKRKKVKP
jgi:hypothetical protein